LGIGDWGMGIGPNPQSPIPNPQSPYIKTNFLRKHKQLNFLKIKKSTKTIIINNILKIYIYKD